MAHTTTQLASVEQLKQELLPRMLEIEEQLHAPETQARFSNSTNPSVKANFVAFRLNYSTQIAKIQNAILENIATKLQQLEPQLRIALNNLDNELQSLEDDVAILNGIKIVTNLVSQMLNFI
jgi:molecular chaperone GrpE (heat shock protein)